MPLGLAAALFVILAGGLSVLLCLSSQKRSKRRLIAVACVLGALALALAVYIALTFLLLDFFKRGAP
jgi:4-amino-4-deoxy-L-arabinose transferase-like glycosyltransferase